MFRLILLISILFHSFVGMSHEFFFSFAEVEVNEMKGTIEATVIATTHDIEKELRSDKSLFQQISGNEQDTSFLSMMEYKINEGFTIYINGEAQRLTLEGVEVMLNGVTNLFLSGKITEPINEMAAYFGFLMKTFPDQQNKMTLRYREQKKTYVFLPNMQRQTIKLSNEND
jgi:hypothetical protein